MMPPATLSPENLAAAQEFVRAHAGLVFAESRRSTFADAVVHAMRNSRVRDPESYLARLRSEPALLDELVAAITVGETYFFRDPQQFAVLKEEVVPALLEARRSRAGLRVWSAGCSTGEEAYSLAIVLYELGLLDGAHVVGTDLCRSALTRARRARYGRWSFRGNPESVIAGYFSRQKNEFQLSARIRDRVEFRYLNLAEDASPSLLGGVVGMDLILCRNVLIYFDDETIARVARRLVDSLSDDGWLLLGASDPPLGGLAPCEAVITRAGLAYRKPAARRSATARTQGLDDQVAWRAVERAMSEESFARPAEAPAFAESPAATLAAVEPAPAETTTDSGQADEAAAEVARCYSRRDYARAATLAGRLVLTDGNDAALWVVLVRALANRGDLDAAGRACAAALDRHRTSAELTYLHALLLGEAGRHAEAAAAARRAIYLEGGLAVAHLALGGALTRLRDATAARRAFRNAHRLLSAMEPDAAPPASDGEPAWRLRERAEAQLRLVGGRSA